MSTVSVALATYNGGRFLQAQLESLASQTLLPDELVIGDDRSSDDTIPIIRAFADKAPFPVRLTINDVNLGHADNFLRTAARCTAPVVAFCDQDDVWLPHKLETGMATMLRHDSLVCLHVSTITDAALNSTGLLKQDILGDAVLPPLSVFPGVGHGYGHTMMIRRPLIDLVPPQSRPSAQWAPGLIGHDTWLYIVASALGRVSHIDEPLVLYRQHGANSSGINNMTLGEKMRAALTVPMHRHIGQARFDEEVTRTMRGIVQRGGPFASRARSAEAIYARRAAAARERVRLYSAPHVGQRLKSLRRCHAEKARIDMSVCKDLLLGVFRVGRIVHE